MSRESTKCCNCVGVVCVSLIVMACVSMSHAAITVGENEEDVYLGANTYVGYEVTTGTATVTVDDGSDASSTNTFIGYNANVAGEVTVSEYGSTWTQVELIVGVYGNGELNVTEGGYVVSTSIGVIAYHSGSTGTVVVDGNDGASHPSAWANGRWMYVGGGPYSRTTGTATGTLELINGGQASGVGAVGVGEKAGDVGTISVNGTDSILTIYAHPTYETGNISVGTWGTGTLDVTAGGRVVLEGTAYVGYETGSTGTVIVAGTNSTQITGSDLYVGHYGDGTLKIGNSGVVSNGGNGYIGRYSGSTGEVAVAGEDSKWVNESDLYVGASGTGTLKIVDHGLVTVDGTLTIDDDDDDDSFIKMATDGQLAILGDYDTNIGYFLDQIDGTDDIRYWAYDYPGGGSWEDIATGNRGNDYTLAYIDDAEDPLDGYTVLTVLGSFLLGDANRDGIVDDDDYAYVQANLGNTSYARDPELIGDANGDGVVTGGDYASIQSHYGDYVGGTGSMAPEPATMCLLGLGGLTMLRRKRK